MAKHVCECGQTFEKPNSLNAHYSHCKIHRKGKEPIDRFKGKRGWAKGLTKETDVRVKKMALSNSGKRKPLTAEWKKNLSLSLKGKTGGFRKGSNKWKGEYVIHEGKKVWLDSSWEKIFVESLNKQKIQWVRNNGQWGFKYKFKEKIHTYYPDFFLPERDS